MVKLTLLKIKARIIYRFIWNIKRRYYLYANHMRRRVLWARHSQDATYKPYGSNKGSGWSGYYEYDGRIIGYVDRFGNVFH